MNAQLVSRLSPEGDLLWTWASDVETNWAFTYDAAFGPAQRSFLVASESPVGTTGVVTPTPHEPMMLPQYCSTYGCTALTVRQVSPTGALLSEFILRSVTSQPLAFGVEGDGFYVAATLRGAEPTVDILRFDL